MSDVFEKVVVQVLSKYLEGVYKQSWIATCFCWDFCHCKCCALLFAVPP